MLFAVYDTETTGLPYHFMADLDQQPRIIEFAGIITDGIQILHELEFIVNPGIAIEEIITKITGLKNSDLEDKPDIAKYIPQLADYFGRADAAVAHNLSFDKSMVHYDLERRNKVLADVNWPAIELCTVEQTMPLFGKRMKLIDLYRHYHGEYEQKHRAMDDVIRLHMVAKSIGLYEVFKEIAQ